MRNNPIKCDLQVEHGCHVPSEQASSSCVSVQLKNMPYHQEEGLLCTIEALLQRNVRKNNKKKQ